jgi:hypothetical protein
MRWISRAFRFTVPRRAFVAACGAVIIALAALGSGCVRRTLTITSEPPGALCLVNGREIGRTPVTVDFLHYGEYDVQLTKDGYEPLLTSGKADAPWWDIIPMDLVAEIGEPHADVRWHYVMEPRLTDRAALVERADALRQKLFIEAPIPPGGTTTQPQPSHEPLDPLPGDSTTQPAPGATTRGSTHP